MTIIAVTKIQMNRMLEAAVANSADNGEFVFTTDSGRLVLGPDPTQGNPNFDRNDRFPYQNQEVLTEGSPRNKELFSLFIRNQDDQDFHPPTLIPNGVGFTNVMTREYEGGILQEILLNGAYNSALIEYHAYVPGYYNSFYHGLGNPTLTPPAPTLIQSGIVRIIADANGAVVSNNTVHTTTISNSATLSTLEFGVATTLDGYIVQAQNNFSSPIMLKLRKTVISVGTFGVAQPSNPVIEPPLWLTLAGSIGTYWQGNAVSYQLVAVDPQGLPLTFS